MDIGFDGATIEGLRAQWVARKRWPTWVKSILRARDRGKCAACNTDIVHELRGEEHIDHIVPIAGGGCNDLVNLQLRRSHCNLKKSDQEAVVTSSVPPYIRRSRKHAGLDRALSRRSVGSATLGQFAPYGVPPERPLRVEKQAFRGRATLMPAIQPADKIPIQQLGAASDCSISSRPRGSVRHARSGNAPRLTPPYAPAPPAAPAPDSRRIRATNSTVLKVPSQ